MSAWSCQLETFLGRYSNEFHFALELVHYIQLLLSPSWKFEFRTSLLAAHIADIGIASCYTLFFRAVVPMLLPSTHALGPLLSDYTVYLIQNNNKY